MGDDLGHGDALLGDAVQRELVEHAVGAVGLDQPLDRQQRRGQRGDPQGAGADPRQQPRVGPDRERHQRHHQQEEGDRQPGRAGRTPRRMSRAMSAPIMRRSSSSSPLAGKRLVRRGEHRAAGRAMRVDQPRRAGSRRRHRARSAARRAATSGAPDAATRASVARLTWPDESSRTGNVGQLLEPERVHRGVERAPPQNAARAEAAARGRARRWSSASAHRAALDRPARPAAGRRRGASGSTCRCRWGRRAAALRRARARGRALRTAAARRASARRP